MKKYTNITTADTKGNTTTHQELTGAEEIVALSAEESRRLMDARSEPFQPNAKIAKAIAAANIALVMYGFIHQGVDL